MPKINKVSSILAEMFFFLKVTFHLFCPVVSCRVYILPPKVYFNTFLSSLTSMEMKCDINCFNNSIQSILEEWLMPASQISFSHCPSSQPRIVQKLFKDQYGEVIKFRMPYIPKREPDMDINNFTKKYNMIYIQIFHTACFCVSIN